MFSGRLVYKCSHKGLLIALIYSNCVQPQKYFDRRSPYPHFCLSFLLASYQAIEKGNCTSLQFPFSMI